MKDKIKWKGFEFTFDTNQMTQVPNAKYYLTLCMGNWYYYWAATKYVPEEEIDKLCDEHLEFLKGLEE